MSISDKLQSKGQIYIGLGKRSFECQIRDNTCQTSFKHQNKGSFWNKKMCVKNSSLTWQHIQILRVNSSINRWNSRCIQDVLRWLVVVVGYRRHSSLQRSVRRIVVGHGLLGNRSHVVDHLTFLVDVIFRFRTGLRFAFLIRNYLILEKPNRNLLFLCILIFFCFIVDWSKKLTKEYDYLKSKCVEITLVLFTSQ